MAFSSYKSTRSIASSGSSAVTTPVFPVGIVPVDDVALGEASRLRGAVFPEDPEPRHLSNLLKG
jgi:hypothetical protein